MELLKNNLDFSKFKIEASDYNEKLYIIPVKEEFKRQKKVDANTIANLLLIVKASGEIRKGNLVLYTADNGQSTTIPDNTFHAVFNTAEPECNGQFRFLSVTGRLIYQLDYKDRRLISAGVVKSKSATDKDASAKTTSDCIDWYLVTTVYFEDGSSYTYEEYLTTTCGNGCHDADLAALCPDDGSAGGAGIPEVEFEEEILKSAKTRWTNVAIFPNVAWIDIDVAVNARFNAKKPEKNRFFSGDLRNFLFRHLTLGDNPQGFGTATEIASFTINSNTSTTTRLKGYTADPDGVTKYNFDGKKDWGLNDFLWH